MEEGEYYGGFHREFSSRRSRAFELSSEYRAQVQAETGGGMNERIRRKEEVGRGGFALQFATSSIVMNAGSEGSTYSVTCPFADVGGHTFWWFDWW